MMDAEYSEPNGKYESSTYVTVFRDIDFFFFRSSTCFMTLIVHRCGHSFVQSSGYQQNPMDVNIKKRDKLHGEKKSCLPDSAVITKEDLWFLLFLKT